MPHYNPKTVLRQVSNTLLKAFFESKGQPLPIAWDKIGETQIQGIYDALLGLPEAVRSQIEVDLQDIHAVATESGVRVLVEESGFLGKPVSAELDRFESSHDKAMWVLLNHPGIWEVAVTFARADSLSGRYWQMRNGLPQQPPDASDAAREKLAQAISAFFVQSEGRGRLCRVEHQRRSEALDYFFVYLSNYPDTDILWDEHELLVREKRRHAFEVVYAFDREAGTLAIYARGGGKIVAILQEIFAQAILGRTIEAEHKDASPYQVDQLKLRSFTFPTDPEDGITDVAMCRLCLSVLGSPRKQITVSLPADGNREAMYDTLDQDLNRSSLPISLLRVARATIVMRLDGRGRTRSLTFDITPKTCNLKSKREELRALGEKYLKRWGLEAA